MTLKRKLGESYVKYKMRVGRGSSYTGEINGILDSVSKAGIIVLVVSKYFHYDIPLWVLPLIWITQKLVEYTLGYVDEKYLHWWQFENNYLSRNLNPWNKEVMEKLDVITQQTKK